MKKVKFKKLIALVIGATMLIPTIGVRAADENGQTKKYIALGDSISYGMSAEQGKGYVDLFYNKLKLANKDMILRNLSVPGATSSDLLKTIEEKAEDIKGAEVVTISIGGNNFLKPTIMAVTKALGVDPSSKDLGNELKLKMAGDPNGSAEKLMALKDDKIYIASLGQGASQLLKDFPQTIAAVRMLAPQAKIYVNNLYNPFPQTNQFYNVYETICTTVNAKLSVLESDRAGSVCKVVDAYSLFKGRTDYVNLDFLTGCFDPHPTSVGHAVLSEKLIAVATSEVNNGDDLTKKTDGEIYKMAYDATIKAVESKTQKDINQARKIIVNMPEKLNWAKSELSTQLDKVQGEIIMNVLLAIDKAKNTMEKKDIEIAKELLLSLMTVEYNDGVKAWAYNLAEKYGVIS